MRKMATDGMVESEVEEDGWGGWVVVLVSGKARLAFFEISERAGRASYIAAPLGAPQILLLPDWPRVASESLPSAVHYF